MMDGLGTWVLVLLDSKTRFTATQASIENEGRPDVHYTVWIRLIGDSFFAATLKHVGMLREQNSSSAGANTLARFK
jgi:hypothetical protein